MGQEEVTVRAALPRFVTAGGMFAIALVVLTSAASAVVEGPPDARLGIFIATPLLLAGTTLGMWRIERSVSPRAATRALAALWVVGAYVIAASKASALLVVMPIASMAVLYGSARWGIAVTAMYTLEIGLVVRRGGGGVESVFRICTGFVAAAAFVVVFSRLMRRERLARATVERLAAELEAANARLREYAVQVEDLATAKERNRLAREIHDSLGHFLTVVHVQIEAARTHMEAEPKLALECLSRARTLTQEGLADVRRSVALLRKPAPPTRPLRETVRQLVDECCAAGMEGDLVVFGTPRALSPPVEFALYRATQEALTNVRRHARAKRFDVELRYEEAAVQLRIRDDGVGAEASDGGFGLLGMRERVQLVGGVIEIRTATGRGFAIDVRVPA